MCRHFSSTAYDLKMIKTKITLHFTGEKAHGKRLFQQPIRASLLADTKTRKYSAQQVIGYKRPGYFR